jgi:hypothetical protein
MLICFFRQLESRDVFDPSQRYIDCSSHLASHIRKRLIPVRAEINYGNYGTDHDLSRGHSKSSDEGAAVELVDTALCHREQ